MHLKYTIALILSFIIFNTQAQSPLESLSFLEGKWEQKGKEAFEIWEQNPDNSFKGKGIIVKNGVEMEFESLRIMGIQNDYFYIAVVPDQNEGKAVYFKLTTIEKNKWQFTNPDHDFPKSISYCKKGKNRIIVTVSGIEKSFDVDLRRVK